MQPPESAVIPGCRIRKARTSDVEAVQRIVNDFARQGLMLSRSRAELYDNLRDFHVCQGPDGLVGACALHVAWEDLGEIKSLGVVPAYQGRGVGAALVRACLAEARDLGLGRVFVLTYHPGFFGRLGFAEVSKEHLPQKVWGECVKCVKFPDCNEVAMLWTAAAEASGHGPAGAG